MAQTRVLLIDAAPGPLLDRELARLLDHGLSPTLNLRRVPAAERAAVRAAWDGRVAFTDFDAFDERELITANVASGLGHDAVKSRSGPPLRAAFLAAATDPALAHPLRVIGRAGAGTDHVDLSAATAHDITVTHTPGSNATGVAEFALAQLLTLTRRLASHNQASHQGSWPPSVTPVAELSELTLGIVGLGLIGRTLASKAAALGMTVHGIGRDGDLRELLTVSQVVSLHLPLTARTHHLIGEAELALLPPGAILLNTARGGIVDERALADALSDPQHPLAAAAVDTFEHEHAAFASPLFDLPNALLTPHVAGMTRTAMTTAALRCADHLAALLAGRAEGIPTVN
ncbi:phosphoglycerate dehydrogenase-like enzyme [Kitasatospora sp. GAS204A]|uniref:NAD(P)-dependent oxidoreductase n=1 Tax=unclassified Kitasatospora TaxID=2633591 RepID=UPI002473841A|nr:NAD(P)-dependent oxidoreductase [Kitasatospora sp. GAS204B]MDH6115764.1 phosphoglycerate dehydrogenase-like enzyme [Kitasatospora sp. GAS204B]